MPDKTPKLAMFMRRLLETVRDVKQAIHTENKTIEAMKNAPPEIRAEVRFDEQTAREIKGDQNQNYRVQNSIRRAAWFAFFAAVIYAGIAAYQAYLMRQATEAAQSAANTASAALNASVTQFRQQVRPYIIVETTRLNRAPTEGVILGIESVIRNTGTTPALNLRLNHNFAFQKTLPCQYAPGTISEENPAITVGAGLTRAVRTFGERGLLKSEAEALRGKTIFVCYSAVFEYDDIFGDSHRTEACSYYQPPKPGAAIGEGDLFLYACKSHNGVK